MGFALTDEDFRRYVKKGEHGGRHLWDELVDLAGAAYGHAFFASPYQRRGDNLLTFWIHPKDTPRSNWTYQSHFVVARSIEEQSLEFGMNIERPDADGLAEEEVDDDTDASRFEAKLRADDDFGKALDSLLSQPGWAAHGSLWRSDEWQALPGTAALQAFVRDAPPNAGYDIWISKSISARQAVALGEGVASEIMSAFQRVAPIWHTVIPDRVRLALGVDAGKLRSPGATDASAYWWVNQGRTYREEREGGFVWAPQRSKDGKEQFHWNNVSKVRKGNIIFHYANGAVRTTSVAERDGYAADKPSNLGGDAWEKNGRRVDVKYEELVAPLPLAEVSEPLRKLKMEYGPINSHGEVNQGYLFSINKAAADILLSRINPKKSGPGPMTTKKSPPKNLILYGPPGTGKTYLTIQRAVALCDGKVPDDRLTLVARFKQLKEEKRIAFVTFHQSYGYEDFIEGIRPVLTGAAAGEDADRKRSEDADRVAYECRPGLFKKICTWAGTTIVRKTDHDVDLGDARIWKMSLGDKNDPEQSFVFDECLRGSYALLGWGFDLDYTGCDTRPAVLEKWRERERDVDPNAYRVTTVHLFKNEVRVGDLLLIPDGLQGFRAVARVTGEYQLHPGERGGYRQRRNVEWLAEFSPPLPVERLLRKNLARQTIYPFDTADVKLEALRKLIAPSNDNGGNNRKATNDDIGGNAAPGAEPYVLIIDEINRGNISKVFGELITLLEPDKRLGEANELTATLPYSGDEFGVPTNLYVLGTMNTADRSIAFMDTALRRRFDFEEMMPGADVVRKKVGVDGVVSGIDVAGMLELLNERIEYLYDRDHQVGHAYFLGVQDLADFRDVFLSRVIPLLQEYFYEDWSKLCVVLGCPYDPETGKAVGSNDYPLITAQVVDHAVGSGVDFSEEKKVRYRVNPAFANAAVADLPEYFRLIMNSDRTPGADALNATEELS